MDHGHEHLPNQPDPPATAHVRDPARSFTGPSTELQTESFEIVPADAGGFLVRLGGRDQSHVDLADPTRIAFPYVRLLADAVDAHAPVGEPLRVIHVGGAGLTLPRYVSVTRPRSRQVVLEPREDLTEEVRRLLPLPARSGIRVRPLDGASGIAELREGSADLVVVDAFVGGRVPADLVTPGVFADVARVLALDGRLLLNLTDRAPFADTRDALAALRPLLPDVAVVVETATWRGRRPGNLVVAAGRTPAPLAALGGGVAGTSVYRVIRGREVSDSLGGGRARGGPDRAL